jgi:hypothetical protein
MLEQHAGAEPKVAKQILHPYTSLDF